MPTQTLLDQLLELRRRRQQQLQAAFQQGTYGPRVMGGGVNMGSMGGGGRSGGLSPLGQDLQRGVIQGALQGASAAALPQAANLTFAAGAPTGLAATGVANAALPAATGSMLGGAATGAAAGASGALGGISGLLALL